MGKYNFNFERADYLTPPFVYLTILEFLGVKEFDLDACCTQELVPAKNHYIDGRNDGLVDPWMKLNWCNPPFNIGYKFMKKAVSEALLGKESFFIVPARTETKYFKEYVLENENCMFTFLKKGLKFLEADTGNEAGVYKNALSILYFGDRARERKEAWNNKVLPFGSIAFTGGIR